MSQSVKRVLFVCVENSNRSQMAEAFARMLGGNAVEAYSAGSKPSGIINPKAITAMGELGYDLSKHGSKSLDELPDIEFDFVATMGCGDACPFIIARKRTDWALPDPKLMDQEEYRQVRDEIKDCVSAMLQELGAQVSASAT
jgi:protein-tyrosine-phosphatase